MKQRRLFSIPPPLQGDEATLLVSFCIPDTPGWRSAATALVSQFDYGRAYDEDTGSILGALDVGKEIFNSMSMCNLDEMTRAIRELTAVIGGRSVDFTQPIPDQVDYSNAAFGLLPMLHEHLQSLGPIPKQGDTIMTSMQKLVEAEGYTGLTIDELVAEINGLQPTLFDRWKDYLEILSFMSDIFPGTTRVDIVGDFFQKLSTARFRHNLLTIQGYQATALRGIMRGIAPFEDDPEAEEQSLLEKYGSIPWLGKAAVAIVEPSPGGEAWLAATTFAQALTSIYQKVVSAWSDWWNNWLNKVENPTPTNNVVTAISSLSGVLGGIDDTGGSQAPNPFINLSAVIAQLAGSINEMAQRCNICGSSGGCGCGGADFNNPAALPPVDDGFTEGGAVEAGWGILPDAPGSSNYQTRKCKIANLVHEGVTSVVSKLAAKASDIATARTMTTALALAFGLVIVSAIVGEVLTPVPIIDAIFVGALTTATLIATYLIGNDIVFSPLLAALTARQQDLVCALYNATSVGQAKTDYQAVLVDEGVDSITAGITSVIISGNWGGLLFADISGFSDQIDEQLAGYNGQIYCDNCAGLRWVENGWGTVQDNGDGTYEVTSEQDGSFHRINIRVDPPGQCLEVENWTSNEQFGASVDNQLTPCVGAPYFLPKPFGQSDLDGICIKSLELAYNQPGGSFTITFSQKECT